MDDEPEIMLDSDKWTISGHACLKNVHFEYPWFTFPSLIMDDDEAPAAVAPQTSITKDKGKKEDN